MRASRSKIAFFSTLVMIAVSVISVVAQTDPAVGVLIFNGRNATGVSQPIPIGVYQVSGKQLGSEVSVKVSKDHIVRFCAAKDGTGNCEEFAEGTHNLASTDFNYIKVAKKVATAATTAPTAASLPPLVVYEMQHWAGRTQAYRPGMYRAIKGEFGNILNDHAMSIVLAKGYRAKFCSEEGYLLRGTGDCEVHEAGRHNLRFATSISFIEVIDLSDTSPDDDKLPVLLYEDPLQVGKKQGFDVGTYFASQGQFKKLRDDEASSITVKDGYRATVCADEPTSGDVGVNCEEFGPGKKNLKSRRTASYLTVSKASN